MTQLNDATYGKLDVFEGTQEFVRELVEKHRFKVHRVRDTDGQLVEGEWWFRCKSAAILYQYDEHLWAADMLSTYQHNRLLRRFGPALTWFGHPAEIVRGGDRGDEHGLHFPSELILPVARILKVRRRARRTQKQRDMAAERMRAYWGAKRAAAG